ncbi:MAG: tRNA preQ1(34) S-adenosylmethionine ribosyltransferase-isomerase QueA [Candidatus Rokubacteria bacterium]|nr:tRNA preQ1(34) S-adenosylmethionine ribosyltransferase-isomerase QueA [Candidatus Rokubacteria bacterium]
MDVGEFDYDLPGDRIAQAPAAARDASRLLLVDRASGALEDHVFRELPDLLRPSDLLVVNDSRVIPARVFARDAAGAEVEILFVEPVTERRWRALVRPGRRCRAGAGLVAGGGAPARLRVVAVEDDGLRVVESLDGTIDDVLATHGLPPLPPYIARHAAPAAEDRERYQTVYGRAPGSVAAPTAGLHFSADVLARLAGRGIEVTALTLHVGPATFRPIRTARVEDHPLPAERVTLPAATAAAVNAARADRRRVVAVGTTATRALEGLARGDGTLEAYDGRVGLYIRPGHRFRVVGALLTNFHLPRTSLLVLVSAFAGRERILRAYRHAIDAGYRFYSYGDATLIV